MRKLFLTALLGACAGSKGAYPTPNNHSTGTASNPPISAEAGSTPTPAVTSAIDLSSEASELLTAHNQYRALHCASGLTWSNELATTAQAWADSLAADHCAFEHSDASYGENLAFHSAGDASTIVAMWYDERASYNWSKPGFSGSTGHFTQVIWKGTRHLGCGIARCNGGRIWVCNYDPPGNVMGMFPTHVPEPKCE